MKKQNMLPPPAEEALLPQGLDNSIWIPYPPLPQSIRGLISRQKQQMKTNNNASHLKLSHIVPLKDSSEIFFYAKMFVEVFLLNGSNNLPGDRLSCLLFVTRPQTETDIRITVTSQSDLLLVQVTSNQHNGPAWKDVQWQSRLNALDLPLSHGFVARVQCSPHDFKTIWNMYDYTIKIHASLSARPDELLKFEGTTKIFQYFDC